MATDEQAVAPDRARFVPWAIFTLAVLMGVAALAVAPPSTANPRSVPDYISSAGGVVWGVTAGLIGALITSKRRDNRVGWLMVAMGPLVTYVVLTSRASETSHPAARAFSVLADGGWLLFIAVFSAFILIFPDGRPLSPRWRRVVWFVSLWPPTFLLAHIVVAPDDLIAGTRPVVPQIVLAVLLVASFVAVSVSAVLRFRRSAGIERQQLKWFAYGTAIGLALVIAGSAVPVWGGPVSSLGLAGPLAGTAVALFRYRLYEIDELISRTFVYGALLAILAGAATASVRLFNAIFVGVTGVGSEDVLVITTLVLATTIAPIKKRLEEIVEKRYKTPTGDLLANESVGLVSTADLEARMRAIVREELERARHAC